MNLPRLFWVGLTVSLIARLALIPNPGFEADISFWKAWGLAVVDKGIIEGLKVSNSNYPTPFMYVLGAMVRVYSLFADPHAFNQFWTNTNLFFLAISKMLPIIADFGIAALILWICHTGLGSGTSSSKQRLDPRVSRGDDTPWVASHMPFLLALVYLLNPVSLIDGAWWGQVDSVGVFIFLAAVAAVLTKRPLLAGVIYMAGVMTKLQNMIYGPVFFLFIWQSLGYAGLVRAVAGSMIAFLGMNIEFFLSRNMGMVISSLTENYDYFPLMSLNAYNLWWIASGAQGMTMSDKLLSVGIMNAKAVGLVLFSSVYLFAVLRQIFASHTIVSLFYCCIVGKPLQKTPQQYNNSDNGTIEAKTGSHVLFRNFLESLLLVNAAFFLFQTQSHDRYAFPLSVFLLLWAAEKIHELRMKNKELMENQSKFFPLFIILYSLFSLFYFYNLHTALIVNYPNNGLPFLSQMTQPLFTITTALGFLVLFIVFVIHLGRSSKAALLGACSFLLGALLWGNLPLMTKSPVSITKLTPFISEQGYGKRQKNMPVNAYLGYSKQSFLSVQYAFYRSGIGTHSPSYIVYDIAGLFKTFTTDYGIDTQAGDKGSAVFEIYGDDRLLFRSEKIGRYDQPRHAEVNVSGVRKLGFVTTEAGDGKNDDHTDWLNPLLWP